MNILKIAALPVAFALLTGTANAALITSPGAPYIPFAQLEAYPATFENVAPGVTWTSTNASTQGGSVYGYTGGYGFAANGYDTENLVGLNDSSDVYGVVDSMTFHFATPVSSVGGYLNWVPSLAPVTIAVYDASDNLLDSLVVSAGGINLVTPNSFYGFTEATADISSFTLTDGYIAVLSGLNGQEITGSVPEPATWAMMLVGMGAIGFAMRRRTAVNVSYA